MEKIDLPKDISDFNNRDDKAYYFQSKEKFIEGIIAEYYIYTTNGYPYYLTKMLDNFEIKYLAKREKIEQIWVN
jgi:hypothetical protein